MSVVHGYVAYSRGNCRCPVCSQAWATYMRAWGARQEPLAPDDTRHGLPSTYNNYRCRCDACRAAWSDYRRERRTAP